MRWLVGAALCVSLGGCHARLPRLVAQGQYDEVIARATRANYEPRRAAARAYATALVEKGRVDRARVVLLRDFRRGSELPSLVALADLERSQGLLGMAAVHYARVADLDRTVLEGRTEACALFERRARDFLALGDPRSASLDLKRAIQACPTSDPGAMAARRELGERVASAVAVFRDQWRARPQDCLDGGCQEDAAVGEARISKRLEGVSGDPLALRRAASELGAQLPPKLLAGQLQAELEGRLGVGLLGDEEIRAWVGTQTWPDLEVAVATLPAGVDAWARMRLARVMAVTDETVSGVPGMPAPGRQDGSVRAAKVVESLGDGGDLRAALAYRVLALSGDLPGAELELSTALRTRIPVSPGPDDGAGSGTGAAQGTGSDGTLPAKSTLHWSMRVPVDDGTALALAAEARLRAAAGDQGLALEIRLRLAQRSASPGVRAVARGEIQQLLAAGRPWSALAVADALRDDGRRSAAAAAIRLGELCGPSCVDPDDRATVERALSPGGMAALRRGLPGALTHRLSPLPGRVDRGCPGLPEALAAGADGPLAAAMDASASDLGSAETGRALGRAIEAESTLACTSRLLVPLLAAGGHGLVAGSVVDMASHGSHRRGASALESLSALALVAGQERRAETLLREAVARSAAPTETLSRAVTVAQILDLRDPMLLALHELVLHGDAGDSRARWMARRARESLVSVHLGDAVGAWGVREAPAGSDVLPGHVSALMRATPPSLRWSTLERLARGVKLPETADERARQLVLGALWGAGEGAASHPVAAARLEPDLPGPGTPAGPCDLGPLELAVGRARAEVPGAVVTDICAPEALLPVFEAALAGAPGPHTVSLAVLGSERQRAGAVSRIARHVGPKGRPGLEALLLAGPMGLEHGDPVPMLTAPLALVRVLWGLDPRPAFLGP